MLKRLMFFMLLIFLLLTGCSAANEEPGPADTASAVLPTGEAEATGQPSPEPTETELPPTATEIPPTPLPTETAVPAEVATVSDVLYATAVDPDAADELMDVYYLPGADAGKPVVIYAHGDNQSKGSGRIFGRLMAKEGYVVLVIDWRDDVTSNRDPAYLREAMEDSLCALRAAAEQGALYGADPQRVIWSGFSSGAWIGSMISIGEGDVESIMDAYAAENDGPAQRVACTAVSPPAQITAFIPSSGAYPGDYWLGNGVNPEWTELFAPLREYSALGHNPDLQVRMIHGAQDFSYDTRFRDAETFAAALRDAGYDIELLPQQGSHESFQQAIIDAVKSLEES